MKSFFVRALLFCPLVVAAAIESIETRQDELAVCCYEWRDVRGNSQLFRNTELSQSVRGDPSGWCIALVERDVNDPDNCDAATATITNGFCGNVGDSVPVVACP
ncbi:hypothetical protein KVR01_004439 [Diaporthe batatas]|uniref:uncharacterized protein n=1 Tax=Diaporthe batatas TaxID=748121 RepID=UPI001D0591F7|nr:uncharacterized protein KVR01_004439 [Diaporthe batatas]KAG8165887.1 hypothetical protein KVR01_004439 [Diaporthe batatas]